ARARRSASSRARVRAPGGRSVESWSPVALAWCSSWCPPEFWRDAVYHTDLAVDRHAHAGVVRTQRGRRQALRTFRLPRRATAWFAAANVAAVELLKPWFYRRAD